MATAREALAGGTEAEPQPAADPVVAPLLPAPRIGDAFTYRSSEDRLDVVVHDQRRHVDGRGNPHEVVVLDMTLRLADFEDPIDLTESIDLPTGLIVVQTATCLPMVKDCWKEDVERTRLFYTAQGLPGALGAGPLWMPQSGSIDVHPNTGDAKSELSVTDVATSWGACKRVEGSFRPDPRVRAPPTVAETQRLVACPGIPLPVELHADHATPTGRDATWTLVSWDQGTGPEIKATRGAWPTDNARFAEGDLARPLSTFRSDVMFFDLASIHETAKTHSDRYGQLASIEGARVVRVMRSGTHDSAVGLLGGEDGHAEEFRIEIQAPDGRVHWAKVEKEINRGKWEKAATETYRLTDEGAAIHAATTPADRSVLDLDAVIQDARRPWATNGSVHAITYPFRWTLNGQDFHGWEPLPGLAALEFSIGFIQPGNDQTKSQIRWTTNYDLLSGTVLWRDVTAADAQDYLEQA